MDDEKLKEEALNAILEDEIGTGVLVTSIDSLAPIPESRALTQLATSINQIATFLTGGGLQQALSMYARSQAVKDILGGLASHEGRKSLDARVLSQNAVEIVEAIEQIFAKYDEKLKAKASGEKRDSKIADSELQYNDWLEKKKLEANAK